MLRWQRRKNHLVLLKLEHIMRWSIVNKGANRLVCCYGGVAVRRFVAVASVWPLYRVAAVTASSRPPLKRLDCTLLSLTLTYTTILKFEVNFREATNILINFDIVLDFIMKWVRNMYLNVTCSQSTPFIDSRYNFIVDSVTLCIITIQNFDQSNNLMAMLICYCR